MEKDRDKIPSHLRAPKKASIGNITAEDLVWIGPNGEVEPDTILRQHGYDPDDPLTLILSAIIRGNPVHGRDGTERLETALDALVGTGRRRGMDEIDGDYELLVDIARKFFSSFHQDNHTEPELADIIREVIAHLPVNDARLRATEDSVIRRLRRKFNANKHVLLARVTSEQNWDRIDASRSVERILEELRVLGVSAV